MYSLFLQVLTEFQEYSHVGGKIAPFELFSYLLVIARETHEGISKFHQKSPEFSGERQRVAALNQFHRKSHRISAVSTFQPNSADITVFQEKS